MSALIITTNYGIEQDELKQPLEALKAAGVPVTHAAVEVSPVQTLVGDKDPGETFEPDALLSDVDASEHDLLVIPGGTINADTLRTDDAAVALVKAFASSGRTIAAICHGPWLLAEADVARGKTATSYPSLETDLRNAGATWVDEELRTCEMEGYTLLTSRTPDDLDAFSAAVVDAAR
ncbi:type 1 glutamine amidotransferase domain-containing protein [Demequina activiva]|uniref:Glutamine amidotransferase n=1 Tax=Demequina activiva TaxID=1582364 RepID=A0A919UKX0_9MICO|nr:type 1 glutamine amidotransferase domain-containing protein [Demequina activiva]GIG54133.1 glutamine amidotransferase [Demequina activiva]